DPCVLRYACHVALPRPAAAASAWQWASAPARPPRFAPSLLPTLVTKNDIGCGVGCAGGCASTSAVGMAATPVRRIIRTTFMPTPPREWNKEFVGEGYSLTARILKRNRSSA